MSVDYDTLSQDEIARIVNRDTTEGLEQWELDVYIEYHTRKRLRKAEYEARAKEYSDYLNRKVAILQQKAADDTAAFRAYCAAIVEGDIYVKPQ